MAIKLSTEKIVKSFRPENGTTFTIDELNDHVGGWIEPFRIGPVWVMQREKSKSECEFNEIASFFFEAPLYGEVLIVPPQQLPSDWDVTDHEDPHITSDMVDNGFLLSLQNALMLKKMREENPGLEINPQEFFIHNHVVPKEEYTYSPPSEDEATDENTTEFFEKVYNYISKSPKQFQNGILLDENSVIVRAKREDLKRVLDVMKGIYLASEQYEKCAVLQQLEESVA